MTGGFSWAGTARPDPEVNIRGNRVSPPAVSLSNRTPACGAPAAPTHGWAMGKPGFPNPLPAGRSPVPSLSGGGPGRGQPSQRYPMFIAALCAPRMGPEVTGKPGFRTCGEPVEPHPCLWGASRAQPRLRHGEPGVPHAPAGGSGKPSQEQVCSFGVVRSANGASSGEARGSTGPLQVGKPGCPTFISYG